MAWALCQECDWMGDAEELICDDPDADGCVCPECGSAEIAVYEDDELEEEEEWEDWSE